MIERADDRDRQVAFRALGLLAGRGDGIEADVGEEDQRGSVGDAGEALGREGRVVLRLDRGEAEHDEEREDRELDHDHDRVEARALAHADDEHAGDQQHEEHRGQVDHAALARRDGDRVGQGAAEHVAQQRVQVAAPAHGHDRDREAVLEDQVPADDPGHELAERGVGVRVGAAGDRDHRRQLGVGEGREHAGDAGEGEREDDRRPGLADRLADDDEDPGADDRADAQRGEIESADGPGQRARVVLGVRDHRIGRLDAEETAEATLRDGLGGHGCRNLPTGLVPNRLTGCGITADHEAGGARGPLSRRGQRSGG